MATAYLRCRLMMDNKSIPPSAKELIAYYQEFLHKWTYKVIAKAKTNGSIPIKESFEYEFPPKGQTPAHFDPIMFVSDEHKMETHQYTTHQMNQSFDITWVFYFNGKERFRRKGQFYDHSLASGQSPAHGGGSALHDEYGINFTNSMTEFRTEKANIQVQKISQGTGWYLVKQTETFDALMNRIFVTPSKVDWEVMSANNAHLGGVSKMTLLRAGQVVIVALERNNPKVKRMMAEAVKAQNAWNRAQMFGGVNPAHLMLTDLLVGGHRLQSVDSKGFVDSTLGYIDAGKPFVDGSLEFKKSLFEQARTAHQKMLNAASPELDKVTTIGGMTKRGTSSAAQNASRSFKLIDGSTLAQKLISWDTGIQGEGARSFIREEARVRHVNFQNGIGGYAQNLDEVAKYSKVLKAGGYVGMVVDVGMSGYKAYDAYQKGDTKKAIEEAGQGVGGLIGGAAGGAAAGGLATVALAVFGIGTGGVGLVVVGLFVAGSAYYGGEKAKELAKWGTDKINENIGDKP